MTVSEAFRRQANTCHQLGSPFTGRLLGLLADRLRDDSAVGATILNWPTDPIADALPLRLAGALHALVLTRQATRLIDVYPPQVPVDDDALWLAVENAFDAHEAAILHFIDSPPQTNEVARSAALAGGFHTIATLTSLPLTILEIGASAGLNLHWDSFCFDLGGTVIHKTAGRPMIAPAWEGPPPVVTDVDVNERAGCDRAPIDIRSEDEVLRLRAYVWPDQTDRLERLDQALAVARKFPVTIDRTDAADWAERRLAQQRDGVTTVLYHSIVWQYLAQESQERLQRLIDRIGKRARATAPFAWLRMEPETQKAAALHLTLWPRGETLFLADVDYHGRWIHWRVGADDLT